MGLKLSAAPKNYEHMKYIGKLYGRLNGKYFDTGKTTNDWDALEAQVVKIEVSPAIEDTTDPPSLPDIRLDDDGYPTEEWLQYLRTYQPKDSGQLIRFIKDYLIPGWWMSERQAQLTKRDDGSYGLSLHTGGWSGNEDTIHTIMSNVWLTQAYMKYTMWKTGGHFFFEIPIVPPNPTSGQIKNNQCNFS